MRIGLLADSFLPQVNGVVIAITELAKAMANRGHEVFILAPKYGENPEFVHHNVRVARFASIPWLIYGGFRIVLPNHSILNYIKRNKIEVLHLHAPLGLGLQAIAISRYLKLPLIGTFHTLLAHPEYLKHAKLNGKYGERLAWKFLNFFHGKCQILTCPSSSIKKEIISHGYKKEVKIIPFGIDTSIFDNSKSAKIKRLYNKKGKLLLFVGRFAHEKNIPFLLRAFSLVVKEVPSTKLVMVGSGPQFNSIKAEIKKAGLERNVILTGQIQRDKLVKSGIYGACDVFINASVTETGPLTLIEAQANGLACVSVKGKGAPIVINNRNGILVKPGDVEGFAREVVQILKNKNLHAKLRGNALKDAKKYDMANIAKTWEKMYAGLHFKVYQPL